MAPARDPGRRLTTRSKPDAALFIRERLPLAPVPTVPEVCLHMADACSGLGGFLEDLAGGRSPSPFWAYPWAGGLALARYVLDHPQSVVGLAVVDIGAGSGLVAIAAALAGARSVVAAEIDSVAITAIGLNAAANNVELATENRDLLDDASLNTADVILAGDVFYDAEIARRVTPFLGRCVKEGLTVLVGDPGRAWLPHARLRRIASYEVRDVGTGAAGGASRASVFRFGNVE